MIAGNVRISKERAGRILYEEAAKAAAGYVDATWEQLIESFSQACQASSKTHVAFLGTAILAKCVDIRADAFAVKESAGSGAYSARGLCHHILVPNAPELDINLGVTGREPLNNQPYFRIERVAPDMPIRETVQPVLDQLLAILQRLQSLKTEADARQALRAFITVRRRYGPRYSQKIGSATAVTLDQLIVIISAFVAEESEGGRRAQAVVAGLMDLFASRERVVVRRVNDPSRTVPGDVCVRALGGGSWERVLEVRDKPVTREDLYVLVSRAAQAQVAEAAMVAVSKSQPAIPIAEAQAWSAQRAVALTVFLDWEPLIRQAAFWSATPQLEGATLLPKVIYERLIDLEVSERAVEAWISRLPDAT